MGAAQGIEPVAVNQVVEGIKIAEEGVGNGDGPGIVLQFLPALDDFGTFEIYLLAGGGLVNDPPGVGRAAARRTDALPVSSFVDSNHIPRLGQLRRRRDGPQRPVRRTVASVVPLYRNMVFRTIHRISLALPAAGETAADRKAHYRTQKNSLYVHNTPFAKLVLF
ncbi:MAG: hypothetical protein BWY71_01295 [Planctomycetes bacterium ADurb.Bin412]|nr:MAG: hypothetical protein BWY71_01295 [Planctomycetes bacterium ADurb.Bin412]